MRSVRIFLAIAATLLLASAGCAEKAPPPSGEQSVNQTRPAAVAERKPASPSTTPPPKTVEKEKTAKPEPVEVPQAATAKPTKPKPEDALAEEIRAQFQALRSEEKAVRDVATRVLAEMGEPAVDALVQALQDQEPKMRTASSAGSHLLSVS